ncbi:M48 family metallopeptidase [Crassaminicella profunda]|uniref:M48 family metallopeptidase n=1 Tax=Crassaminicella profunda TaxID=1286698 RepID=UPI001CA60D0A|nr:SprT family zinc-dependent metalloprotease [Crassaminicella profunda]QZY55929.1 M48 family metallopeptidase [Crassaminicella profunda]
MQIEYNNDIITFTIEYRKRKTVQIEIDPACRVKVLAPKGTNEEAIVDLVKSKASLILEKLNELRNKHELIKEGNNKNRERLLYLGSEYPVEVMIDESILKDKISFEQDTFFITVKSSEKKILNKALEKFYRKKCLKTIQQRVTYYQKHFKVKPKEIKVIASKDKWGSCHSNRNLEFNWTLIMGPIEVIDYIVVHEMCHLMHMNHSKSFWRLVGKILPDYKKRSEWLQYNGARMKI